MWICEKCKEEHEDIFDSCWKCQSLKINLDDVKKTIKDGGEDVVENSDKESVDKENGCLINILSVVGAVIALFLGVAIQISIYGSGGPDAPGAGILVGAVFGAYYLIKKELKKYFKK
ncbi:MAG: hypothetical protein CMD58_02705 [Gammaproteobacteria bacterium]|nr:hypothetical protein [Gammaproteobacteria bacterium]